MIPHLHHYAWLCLLTLGSGTLCLGAPPAGNVAKTSLPETDLFSAGTIPRLRIELDAAAVDSLRKNPREFVPATVFDGTVTYPQVAIHLKGSLGSFRPFDDKPALTLDFSRFQNGRKFHGLRRIYLNNSVEDPSYANEILGSEFFQAAGVPAPRVTRALVELNAGKFRLYVLKEGFTEDFLARHFHNVSGELYEPGTGHDVNEKLDRNSVEVPFDRNRAALNNLSASVQETDPAQRWQKLEAALDTRQFLTFMAAEVMLGHRDGYCINRNNFRVYHDLDSGKILFFPQGMDQLLGTAELPWQPNWSGLVAQAVMSTPEGQRGYAATFGLLLTNDFIVEKLTSRVDELVQELRSALDKDDFAKVKAAADVVKERIVKRKLSLVAQLNRPALKPLEFTADSAHPEEWEIAERPAQGSIEQTKFDGLTTLHILAQSESLASWHTIVLLPRGRYRFEDRVRVAGVKPLPFGAHSGARLRVGGGVQETVSLAGDSSWQDLAADFEVGQPLAKVELFCELRARAGEVWFDLTTMRVLRIKSYEN
jgi:hypothetical protein